MKLLYTFFAAALLAGCATYQPPTASGKPEIVIAARSVEEIREAVVAESALIGYLPRSSDSLNLVFERESDSTAATVLFGTRMDPRVFGRSRFHIIKDGDRYKVIGTLAAVSNRGTALESETELTGENYRLVEKFLAKVQARLAR